jgi:aminoglycoside phosphotransferase (APT) family kinase protein
MTAATDRQALFGGTRPVQGHLSIDAHALEAYLADHIEGFGGPIRVEQFKGGQSNPTYKITTPEGDYVLRRKPPGKLLPSAHAVDREFRVIRALHAEGFPVPRPLALCEDESVIGTAFHVTSFVTGRIFWEPHAPGIAAGERRAIFGSVNATLARLHGIDYRRAGLSDFGRAEGYVGRQVTRWTKQYRASETERIEAMDMLMGWLPEAAPDQREASLIHGDYRLDNCIIEAASADVAAVLDWELSTIGDPIADFTYHLMQWHMPPGDGGVGTLVGHEADAPGLPAMEDYVAEYCGHRGISGIPDLQVYLAYNFFRLAAIFQGIAGRVRDGSAVSPNAALMARHVRPMAETAWRFAKEAGA